MTNNINSSVNKNYSGNNNAGMHQLFFGDDKMTATYLILIGSMINFFLNMRQRKIPSNQIAIHLSIIVLIGFLLSGL